MKENKSELEKAEEVIECQFCQEKAVVFDGVDKCGHYNFYCKICGEPQDD